MGLSGWACLLLFMPLASAFVLFALLVFKSKNENNPYGSPQAPRDFVGILFGRRSNNESVQLSAPVTPIAPAMNPAVVTGNYYHVNRGSREYVAIALLAATGLMVLCFVAMVAISAGLDEHSPSAEEFNAFGMVFLNFVLLLTIGDVIWGIYGLKEAGANTNSRYHVALMTVGLIVLVLDLILHI